MEDKAMEFVLKRKIVNFPEHEIFNLAATKFQKVKLFKDDIQSERYTSVL